MNDHFTKIRDYFLAALERDGLELQLQYAAKHCADLPDLHAKLEEMLRAHHQPGGFLASRAEPPPTFDQPPVERPGTQIGPYKLIEQIGEGGFGTVYMAEQQEPIRRKVALKLLKPGMDTKQVVARFEAERQALAIMDHPNISKVLDGGATEAGRPYFVMELVRGLPITEFCDEHKLSTNDRLKLFVDVCQAIQHAHQKGVIHRDVKPSNVLVTKHDVLAVPKVIDFGIAKAAGASLTDKTLVTSFAQMIGTPLYMSPEQAEMNNLDVDTRSDIYSLGVLLYELLTGTTPFDKETFKKAGYDEMRRLIKEEEPQRPSQRISTLNAKEQSTVSARRNTSDTRELTNQLRGELDWIVMRAMEKDRTRRYETANAFAADVQRYLNDEPVQACPPSAGYRFRKFARRNKRTLETGALLSALLLVTVGAIAGSIGWTARDRDARQAAIEQEVNLALKEAERLLGQGKYPDALSAAKRAQGILAGGGSDVLRERMREMRKDLEMVLLLGAIRMQRHVVNTGTEHDQRSEATYAKAFRDYGIDVESLPIHEAVERIRARPIWLELVLGLDDWLLVGSWKASQDNWGIEGMKKALAESKLGSWEAGHDRWIALMAVARAADPDPWRNRLRETLEPKKRKAVLRELAASDNARNLATVNLFLLNHSSTMNDAPELVESVLRQARQHNPGDFWINLGLAYSLSKLDPPQTDESIRYFSVALALRPDSHFVHCSLGAHLSRKGKVEEAIVCYRKAIELNPKYVLAHNNLGLVLKNQGKLDEAIVQYKKALELDPKYTAAHNNLGSALASQKKYDEAIAEYKQALELDPKYAAAHNNNLAWLLATCPDEKLRDPKRAVELARKAIEITPGDVAIHNTLGVALYRDGQYKEAIPALEKSLELLKGQYFAHNGFFIAASRWKLGEKEEAKKWYDRSVEWLEKNAAVTDKDEELHRFRAEAIQLLGGSEATNETKK